MAARMAQMWYELGVVDLGAELDAMDLGAKLADIQASSSSAKWRRAALSTHIEESSANALKVLFTSQIFSQILLCKKKIPVTSKCRHIYEVLNVDEIKN
jgi:hypothetical protein